jgi:Fe-S-cluster containining protein
MHDLSPAASVLETYRELLYRLNSWFAGASARHPGVIPCRAGCAACCLGPFDISVVDTLLVQDAWERLPAADREAVTLRAARIVSQMDGAEPSWAAPHDIRTLGEDRFDLIAESLEAEPCPLLDDTGSCRIYEDRPLVCRIMGLGIRTPAGRVIENGCPIQDRFPVYEALPPQSFDLEALEETELACLEGAAVVLFDTPAHAGYETTIAHAILDAGRRPNAIPRQP